MRIRMIAKNEKRWFAIAKSMPFEANTIAAFPEGAAKKDASVSGVNFRVSGDF